MAEPERKGLTRRRYLFCLEYVKDYNASAAALRAGYSEDRAQQTGSDLMQLPEIIDIIDNIEADRLAALKITGENVLKRVDEVAKKALADGDLANANRALELLGRNKLWEKGGGSIKSISSNTDGTMKISFDEGE